MATLTKKKAIPIQRYLMTIYQEIREKVIDVSYPILLPSSRVYFGFVMGDKNTYCQPLKGGQYRITFGGGTLTHVLQLPTSGDISRIDGAKHFKGVNFLFRGLYYHEMAHLIYTDLSFMGIQEYPTADLRTSLHSLFNILEDIYIETRGLRIDYPYVSKYLNFLVRHAFSDDVMSKYSDSNDATSFLTYVLYKLRRGKDFTGVNKFFDDHREDMLQHIKEVLMTHHATDRIKRIIVFFEWLLSLKEIDFTVVSPPAISSAPTSKSGTAGKSGASPASGSASSGDGDGDAGDVDEAFDSRPDESASLTDPNNASGPSGGKAASSSGSDESELEYPDPDNDPSIDEERIFESAYEMIGYHNHEHLLVKDEVLINKDVSIILDMIEEEVSQVITETVTAIKAFKTRNRPKYLPGHTSGKLHVPSAIQNINTPIPIYKRKVGKGVNTDLAISLLLDNSGSMGGMKSEITTKATLALARACTRMDIPFEVNAFTESMNVQTFTIKSFSEKFENTRDYFGITSTKLSSAYSTGNIATFAGNIDEVNLNFVANRFLTTSYDQKVLIVISDGATCGSTNDLKKLAEYFEEQGIYIIGLGILDDTVSRIYSNYKVFKNTKSLEELPQFLTEMLLSFARKGVR